MAEPPPPAPVATSAPGAEAGLRLADDSRVDFRPLTITEDDGSVMVGDLARGEFIEVPPIAVVVIDALRGGHTIAGTADIARAHAGQDVDVADFVQTMCELGFVAGVDGTPIQSDGPELTDGGRAGAMLARLARPLYSLPAWVCYGLLFAVCLVTMIAFPWLRPRYGQLFFLANPVLSLALVTVISMVLRLLHELAHWVGARIEGIPARITISRRYYVLVAQTDLSATWALPRRRRYGPLLAGMAFDIVVLAALLGVRAAQYGGWWHLPAELSRLIAALVVLQVFAISFQFLFFLRTDLYGVLITGLGCLNLSQVSRLRMARLYRRLTAAEKDELAAADPRDTAAARWYGWVQLAGLALAIFYFIAFLIPAVVHLLAWIVNGLARSSPAGSAFWVVLVSGCIACVPVVLPPASYLLDRRRRSRRARTPSIAVEDSRQ
jgi:putative peptide zinc metalloprotease protein